LRQLKHRNVGIVTATVLTVAVVFYCPGGGQPRRFPVELEILAANAADLLSPQLSSRYKQGLRLRMAGSLGTLRFLAREYLQATHRRDKQASSRIDELRQSFSRGDWQTFARESQSLAQDYPLDVNGLRPGDASREDRKAGRHIYRRLCMGCHEHPDTTQAIPAPDLYRMVRTRPQWEYIARLIGGVHGTPAVALRNPFSNREIAGLAAYLIRAKQPAPSQVP
jgi:mono/diheme cytochrome c family protein